MNIQKISVLLCVIITTSLFSMEKDAMEIENNYCYIAELPGDITDLIGRYVGCAESDEDFIERTKQPHKNKIVFLEYRQLCPAYENIMDNTMIFDAWGSDNLILAMLKYVYDNKSPEREALKNAQLTIIDTKKKIQLDSRLLDKQKYERVAVSRGGHLFATVHQNKIDNKNCAESILTIQNVIMNQQQEVIIPKSFVLNSDYTCSTIAFNHQITRVVIQGNFHFEPDCCGKQQLVKNHLIVPIEIWTPSDTLTSLGVYFARKGVCKNLPKQLEYCKQHGI